MSSESLLFSTARISSVSKNLLSQDRVQKLMEAGGLESAVKFLYEYGYGSGLTLASFLEYEKLLSAEENKLNDYIAEIAPKGYGFETFFFRNDFHNAKLLAKEKYGNVTADKSSFMTKFELDIDELKNHIILSEFDKLPPEMAQAFVAIDKAFGELKGSPNIIDIQLDKAYFVAVFNHLKKCRGAKAIKTYFSKKVDLSNVINFFRCKRLGFSFEKYADIFMPTGSFGVEVLRRAYVEDSERLAEVFKQTDLWEFVEVCKENNSSSLVSAETLMDNMLLKIMREYKYDMFSIGCIANYYFGKLTEIKEVKMILACIKNNVKPEQIKQRLRELYA
ncbi:MAG: V-type ATPase subunit [Clostridia bacterium]